MKKQLLILLPLLVLASAACNEEQSPKMEPFKLSSVKITEGPFYNAQQTSLNYILEMDVDRLLAPFMAEAGLDPDAEPYGDWESGGLDGHIGGHYLSALSLMYASTGNREVLERLEYMTGKLEECQKKDNSGYVGGIPDGRSMWDEIASGKIDAHPFSLNGRWVPWYNIHKLFAGLRDAYLFTGNEKALGILTGLSDWCYDLTENLSDEQMQDMLRSEFGGMNEVLADVASITGSDRYLQLAERFAHMAILDPLVERRDELTGLHANTQIPKVIGFLRTARLSGDNEMADAAEFFWNTVVENRTVSIGGNSVREHFNPVDDFSSMMEHAEGPETCNTHNMMKLSQMLFLTEPDAGYIDYYERALYNHILSSQHPEKGGYVYFTPTRPNHYRVYSQPHESFWCCVGTGLENHAKYGELIYAHKDDDLFVNLFIPSTLNWQEKGITLNQSTRFPYEESSLIMIQSDTPKKFAINIRYPGWIRKNEMSVSVNGESVVADNHPASYITIERTWQSGDSISIRLPMHSKAEYLPDGSPWASILHGPIVMAAPTVQADLDGLFAQAVQMHRDQVAEGRLYPAEMNQRLARKGLDKLDSLLIPERDHNLSFRMADELLYTPETADELVLVPFFEIHETRYMLYWPVEDN